MFMSLCGTAEVLNVIRIIKIFITIIKIVVPILLIVSAMTTYLKAVTSGDLQKSNKALLNKVLAGVIIFLVPTVVSVIINVAWTDSEVNQCLVNATSENIAQVRINHTHDLIDRLEKNLTSSNYNSALSSTKKIKDSDIKEELTEKIKSYEKYVALSKEIDDLAQNYNRSKYKELHSTIANIEIENIRNNFLERIEEIGGKPLNIASGAYPSAQGDLSYSVYIPDFATEKMPLIMYLHGDGGGGEWLYAKARSIYGMEFPFIIIGPQGGMWNETSGRKENLKSILDKVCKEYSCDTSRISITGYSRGAIGAWKMVDKYPNYFYTAVPVSCSARINASNFLKTKVRAFCGNVGDERGYYRVMNRSVNAIVNAGGDATLTVFNADHGGTPPLAYTKDLLDWMID